MRSFMISMWLVLVLPSAVQAKVIAWDGKPISVSISAERLTRVEFPENLRSVFLSRADIAVEKEERSLYVRALAPEIEDTLFVVGESGTAYQIDLSTSDNPDQTVVIFHIPKSLQVQAEQARQVPALDLMRSMMRGLPVGGYEVIKADRKEVYRDAFFSMKFVGGNSGGSIQQLTRSMRGIQTLAPWQGSPEWSFPIFRITSCSGARAGWMFSSPLMTGKNTSICYLNRLPKTR